MKLALLLAVLLTATAMAGSPNDQPETLEIPLDEIWGYALPGTRDIAGLPLPEDRPIQITDASLRRQRENQIELIRQQLASQPTTEIAASGFVIPRQPDLEALRRFRIPTRPKDRLFARLSYPEGTDLTLAFFSYPSAYNVRLRKVERQGNQITVHYQFEPHKKPEVTVHFAMIPLGKLPAGDYRVSYEQIPMDREYLDAGFEPGNDGAICRGFAFKVFERPTDEPPIEGATMIPLDRIWADRMPGTQSIRKLDNPMVNDLVMSMAETSRRGEPAGPGFVVVGTDKDAFEKARSILKGEAKFDRYLPRDSDLTLVFYAGMFTPYVRIVSVETLERRIVVKYRFVVHGRGHTRPTIALIPLGKLSEGRYEVEMKQLPPVDLLDRPATYFPNPEGIICEDFTFWVEGF